MNILLGNLPALPGNGASINNDSTNIEIAKNFYNFLIEQEKSLPPILTKSSSSSSNTIQSVAIEKLKSEQKIIDITQIKENLKEYTQKIGFIVSTQDGSNSVIISAYSCIDISNDVWTLDNIYERIGIKQYTIYKKRETENTGQSILSIDLYLFSSIDENGNVKDKKSFKTIIFPINKINGLDNTSDIIIKIKSNYKHEPSIYVQQIDNPVPLTIDFKSDEIFKVFNSNVSNEPEKQSDDANYTFVNPDNAKLVPGVDIDQDGNNFVTKDGQIITTIITNKSNEAKELGRLSKLQNKISQMTPKQQAEFQPLIDSIYSILNSDEDKKKVESGIDLLTKQAEEEAKLEAEAKVKVEEETRLAADEAAKLKADGDVLPQVAVASLASEVQRQGEEAVAVAAAEVAKAARKDEKASKAEEERKNAEALKAEEAEMARKVEEARKAEAALAELKEKDENHPDTLNSIGNLALLHHNEAERLYRDALYKMKVNQELGEEHPDTLNMMNNLAILLQAKGKLDEAEKLYRTALEIMKRVLGEDHTDTLKLMEKLDVLLQAQKQPIVSNNQSSTIPQPTSSPNEEDKLPQATDADVKYIIKEINKELNFPNLRLILENKFTPDQKTELYNALNEKWNKCDYVDNGLADGNYYAAFEKCFLRLLNKDSDANRNALALNLHEENEKKRRKLVNLEKFTGNTFNQILRIGISNDEKDKICKNISNKIENISKLDDQSIQLLAQLLNHVASDGQIKDFIKKINEKILEENQGKQKLSCDQLKKLEYLRSLLMKNVIKDCRNQTKEKEENHLKTANLALTKMKYNWIKKNNKTNKNLYDTYQSALKKLTEEQKDKLENRYENIKALINKDELKIIDYLTSPKIVSMILFKLIVYALVAAATAAAVKSFTKLYTQRVYTQNLAPPPLTQMLGIFLAFCLTFVGILLVLLWAAGQVATGPIFRGADSYIELVGEYYINDHLFSFVLDFLIFITALSLVTLVFVLFLEDRRFFRYQTEGLRAVRVTRDILLSVGAFLIVWPYFLIF